MLIVGLTGGVASGKSLVSQVWKEEGAHIIDADQISRDLVRPRTSPWRALVKGFGKEILRQDGSIDRRKLADRVFSNPAERDLLNSILHPRIKREIERRIREIGRKGSKEAIVVIDAPLLVETGYHREVDQVVVVTSSERQQIRRLRGREGVDEEFARRILASQISREERTKVADFIIRNEGSRRETERKAKDIFHKLKEVAVQKRGREGSRPRPS